LACLKRVDPRRDLHEICSGDRDLIAPKAAARQEDDAVAGP